MKVRIWGTRGSIPSPLKPEEVEDKIRYALQQIWKTPDLDTSNLDAVLERLSALPMLVRRTAGGNTPCVEIQADGELLIMDAGSGMRELGIELMRGPCGRGKGVIHIFISHCHWDHIQGFPMFLPAFVPGNRIYLYGMHDLQRAFETQQNPLTWPVDLDYMRATKEFIPLELGQTQTIGKVRVTSAHNTHPGDAYSYRVEDSHSALVYATDAEYKQLDATALQPRIEFFKNADALIFDSQYTLTEVWQTRVDFGHGSALIGIDLAQAAGVKKLILFHHDPTYSDLKLLEISERAIDYQAQTNPLHPCEVILAYEGLTIDLTPPGSVGLQHLPDDDAVILTPASMFDERGVKQLAHQLNHLATQTPDATPILDLSNVETLTTSNLKALVALRQKQGQSPLILAAPSATVRRVIELGGYNDFFAIYPTLEAALTAVQARELFNLPGQLIKKRYQIERKVGAGRLGIVLMATDTASGRAVAVKILYPSFREETVARMMQQTPQIKLLDHPNILRMFDLDKEGGYTYRVEEYVEGRHLHEILEETPLLPFDQALGIALDIIGALEYAHSRGILHGDLKPQNVFLAEDGAKLSGFGLGRLEEGRNLLDVPLLFLTATYLAPEQILGQPLDARTDLYAFGVLLYQLFTGQLPFSGSSQEVIQAHLRREPRPPRELNPQLPISLDHLILRLLAQNPNERYASARQALSILENLVSGGEDVSLKRWYLMVGRETASARLRACWAEANAGHGQIAFISGESGLGKTSLAHHVAAQTHPPVLLVGHCQEIEGGPPYQLFTDVLQMYLATVPPELLNKEVRQWLSNFLRLVPEIHQMYPDVPEPMPLEPQQEQLRLMASLSQIIRHATQERPWYLILDDLQWADASSLELLRYLGRHVSSMALLIVGIYRDEDLDHGHPLLDTLRDLRALSTYHHIPLQRLSKDEVEQLLTFIWQQPAPPELVTKIYQHTAGNPFYVQEVAKGLLDEGLITRLDGVLQFPALEEVRLPQSVRETVWRRINHLSPDTQTLLNQAAVLGQTFHFDDLREMSGFSEWEVLERLNPALERQLMQEIPDGDMTLRFCQTEIQHVLYTDLGPLRRRILHRQAGEALERRPHAEHRIEELARHFILAGESEKAIAYGMEAARQAQASYANDNAVLWHTRVLDLLAKLPPERQTVHQSLKLSIHEALGEIHSLAGRYKEALAHYAEARALAPRPTHLADLCRKTAAVYERQNDYQAAFEWLEVGLRYLETRTPTLEIARLYLAKAEAYSRCHDSEQAIIWCQKSLTVAHALPPSSGDAVIARGYNLLGSLHTHSGDPAQAVVVCLESAHLYRQIDDPIGEAHAYYDLSEAHTYGDDWNAALDAARQSLEIRRRVGDIYGQAQSLQQLANLMSARGEWDTAVGLYQHALTLWEQIGGVRERGLTLAQLGHLYTRHGAPEQAHALFEQAQTLFNRVNAHSDLAIIEHFWAIHYLHQEMPERAYLHIQRALAMPNHAPLYRGRVERTLGQIHLARRERQAAATALHRSLHALEITAHLYETALTKMALATLMLEVGAEDEGHAYLQEATQVFERLGAQADLQIACNFKEAL